MSGRDDLDRSQHMPDLFDRQLGVLHDLPDVVKTKPSTMRHVPPLGVGGSQVFIVQTYRQAEKGDTIFLEVVGNAGTVRVVIPPAVANTIARQRDALTSKTRSKSSTATAAARAEAGILPGFMKGKKGGAK
ncbi:MAG: hypothetical protein M3167_06035 [Acidobacteriota bacterium]|nr:hypothetical protein [Acidobacteriota bacterium]